MLGHVVRRAEEVEHAAEGTLSLVEPMGRERMCEAATVKWLLYRLLVEDSKSSKRLAESRQH
jgi:hypothetical protein